MFGPGPGKVGYIHTDNEKLLTVRRQFVLEVLDLVYRQKQTLERQFKETEEQLAQEHWMVTQLMNQAPEEIQAQVIMDRRVNLMDPDFSFDAWLKNLPEGPITTASAS